MGRYTEQDIARIEALRARREGTKGRRSRRIPGIMPSHVDPTKAWDAYVQAGQVLGTGLGTLYAMSPFSAPHDIARKVGDLAGVKDPYPFQPPDLGRLPEAISAGIETFKDPDQDYIAAMRAYQDELDAGWGYWGASELAGAVALPGGPYGAGAKVVSKAPSIAQAAMKLVPGTAKPGLRAGAEQALTTGIKGVGETLKLPWRAEEAVGRAVLGTGKKGFQFLTGTGKTMPQVTKALPEQELVPTTPVDDIPPLTSAERKAQQDLINDLEAQELWGTPTTRQGPEGIPVRQTRETATPQSRAKAAEAQQYGQGDVTFDDNISEKIQQEWRLILAGLNPFKIFDRSSTTGYRTHQHIIFEAKAKKAGWVEGDPSEANMAIANKFADEADEAYRIEMKQEPPGKMPQKYFESDIDIAEGSTIVPRNAEDIQKIFNDMERQINDINWIARIGSTGDLLPQLTTILRRNLNIREDFKPVFEDIIPKLFRKEALTLDEAGMWNSYKKAVDDIQIFEPDEWMKIINQSSGLGADNIPNQVGLLRKDQINLLEGWASGSKIPKYTSTPFKTPGPQDVRIPVRTKGTRKGKEAPQFDPTTPEGLKAEIAQLKKVIFDVKKARRELLKLGRSANRKQVKKFDEEILARQQTLGEYQKSYQEMLAKARKEIPLSSAFHAEQEAFLKLYKQAIDSQIEDINSRLIPGRKRIPKIDQQEGGPRWVDDPVDPITRADLNEAAAEGIDLYNIHANAMKQAQKEYDKLIDELASKQRTASRRTPLEDGVPNTDPMGGIPSPKMSRMSRYYNAVGDHIPFFGGKAPFMPQRDPTKGFNRWRYEESIHGVLQTSKRIREQNKNVYESMSKDILAWARYQASKVFKLNKNGEIKVGEQSAKPGVYVMDDALANRVIIQNKEGELLTIQRPAIQDITDHFDEYLPYLTDEQETFLRSLMDRMEKGNVRLDGAIETPGFNVVLREAIGMPEARTRPGIQPGNVYVPRGSVISQNGEQVAVLQEMDIISRIDKKRPILSAEQEAKRPAMGVLKRADNKTFMENPMYEPLWTTLEKYVKGVGDRMADTGLERTVEAAIIKSPLDIPEIIPKGTRLFKPMGQASERIQAALKEEATGLETYTQPYLLQNLRDVPLDTAWGRALNREFGASHDLAPHRLWQKLNKFARIRAIVVVNNLYRAHKSTMDLSPIGVHGHIAAAVEPKIWAAASHKAFSALRKGEGVWDEMMNAYNVMAKDLNLPTSDIWARFGLRIGGGATEFQMPYIEQLRNVKWKAGQGAGQALGTAYEHTNIAFGTFGDYLRLNWAQHLLEAELAKGRTIKQLMDDGTLRQIAEATNKMTGWSDATMAEDLLSGLIFAQRYLKSKVQTYISALEGAARYTAGKVGVGSGVRNKQQEVHMRSMVRFIGLAAYTTELINWIAGHETDRRPFVDGRFNYNFYNIRVGGQEFNLFGPTQGMLAALTHMARGDVDKAVRSMGSGVVRIFADLWTGFDFHGKETPISITGRQVYDEDDNTLKREFFNPGALSRYISQLVAPIALTSIWEQGGRVITEDIPALMKGEPGAGLRVATSVGAIPLQFAGGRTSPASPTDEKDDIALQIYGARYGEFRDGPRKNSHIQEHIDTVFEDRFGKQEQTGAHGELRKAKEAAVESRREALQKAVDKYLAGDILGDEYNPVKFRTEAAKVIGIYTLAVHGKWNRNKKRLTGGINELLYDRDKKPEDTEPGTLEYDLARYYEINEKAQNEDGEMDWETRDRLESDFWNSITTVERLFQVLANIRSMEIRDPEGYRRSKEAGRYAAAYEWTDDDGWTGNYYDLEKHPKVISELSVATGYTPNRIREWLDMEFWRRLPSAESTETGEKIADALAVSEREGVVFHLKDTFLKESPTSWKIAMYEAGYKHKYANIIRDNLRLQQEAGMNVQRYDYDAELKKLLIGKINNQG